ncbi:hypothetical protein [Paenibacillus apii]|uniref:hypothetical protein n=1 Tax=Paenibacillus apii TaxID=1850370 RepID=UPI001438A3E9|nr:hypothetical protein [Paenibacillus apii]NJJ37844.1 hypothetical protein [Paenibacillus apii]
MKNGLGRFRTTASGGFDSNFNLSVKWSCSSSLVTKYGCFYSKQRSVFAAGAKRTPSMDLIKGVVIIKQRVTQQQFEELSDSQKDKLLSWQKNRNISQRLLTIGEMLWFLDDHFRNTPNFRNWTLGDLVTDIDTFEVSQICDVLWKEIKYIL